MQKFLQGIGKINHHVSFHTSIYILNHNLLYKIVRYSFHYYFLFLMHFIKVMCIHSNWLLWNTRERVIYELLIHANILNKSYTFLPPHVHSYYNTNVSMHDESWKLRTVYPFYAIQIENKFLIQLFLMDMRLNYRISLIC